MKLIFDKLNQLNYQLSARKQLNKDETVDSLLEILVLSYSLGVADTEETLSGLLTPSELSMKEAIYQKIDGEDFVDRTNKYAEQGDIPSIMRVAETDALRCYNVGAYDYATMNGATTKTWVAIMDERTRDTHWYLDGTTVGINDYFYSISGAKTLYPHQFGVPEEDCNCRCIATYSK